MSETELLGQVRAVRTKRRESQPPEGWRARGHRCKDRFRRTWVVRSAQRRRHPRDDFDRGARMTRDPIHVEPLHSPVKLVKLPSTSGYAAIGNTWLAI